MRLCYDYLRRIALVSDLHVGSRFGLCPTKYMTTGGDNLSQAMNTGQKELMDHWKSFTRTMLHDFKVDTVFILGDALAGQNPKEFGLYMMTTDMDEQLEMAIKVLEPLCRGKEIYVWNGSAYHESRDTKIHRYLAAELQGKFMGMISNMEIRPTRKVVNVAHRSTEAMVYPETAYGRDIMFLKDAEAQGKLYHTNAIIRGHRHSYVEIHKSDIHYISLPCWQAFVPAEINVRWYFKYQPDIGGAVMLADAHERLRFMHFLYPCPKISDKLVPI